MFFGEPFGGLITGARGAVLAILLRTSDTLTGRQIHRMVRDHYSLWSVQEALRALAQLGLIDTRAVGRASVHTLNTGHSFVAPLRTLADPVTALRSAIQEAAGPDLQAAILFGSIARGDADIDSDIDLAVIAPTAWDRRSELQDNVQTRLGNQCDVLVFTEPEFHQAAAAGEPVVQDILREGVALIGRKPRTKRQVA